MRKTWVKLKRGLLIDPKHRLALGNRIWLYMYMLDIADWDTGKIIEWRDKDAADELHMPLVTVRNQRREIEEAGYISCSQQHRRQVITIKRWVNPREYSGKVYNTGGEEWDIDDGDDSTAPNETDAKSDGNVNGDNNGVNHGDVNGGQKLTPLHINHISHITSQYTDGEMDLFDACARVYEKLKGKLVTDPSSFALMISNFKKHKTTPEDYAGAIIAMSNDPKYKHADKPTSFEKYTLGITEKRLNPVTIENNNGYKKDDYPENDPDKIWPGSDGNLYNNYGEVVGTWQK